MHHLASFLALLSSFVATARRNEYSTKSGIKAWVDPSSPDDAQQITTSRGETWHLVMSDEFNTANRSFRPGDDHIWTSLEKPDGVNGALEFFSHNMTSTRCDDDGTCYFYIEAIDDVTSVSVYNTYLQPPGFETVIFYYRAAMVQSWNKFCFQGGLIEARVQLPGAVSNNSGNPDLTLGKSGRVASRNYYPTWPGIWMMGNLGRATFMASTTRMWPFSYNKCEPDVFDPKNQRINACDDDPGYGLKKNQGRGAPEIDIVEGGGLEISSSLQIAPGMPSEYRLFPVDKNYDLEDMFCIFKYNCETPGANFIDIPTAYYEKERGHRSWYQGLRYAANNFCKSVADEKQDVDEVKTSLKSGIENNYCTSSTCPASYDSNSNLDLIDGLGENYWGINTNGTCFPIMNSYMGVFLCDPDNTDTHCATPRNSATPKTNTMKPFDYQMDAISANWPVHLSVYTDYFVYQVEWVTGESGYIRWMGAGQPLFEITADALSTVPQNGKKSNPQKLMVEEPMSIIFNVALSSSWSTMPSNPGSECRGDGSDMEANKICDDYPMFMKIDYIRLYQDLKGSRGDNDYMQLGCDPESHPTREWIQGHLDDYEEADNRWVEVVGKAFGDTDDDCTINNNGTQKLVTGRCIQSRCTCSHPDAWGGPRCTFALAEQLSGAAYMSQRTYGPPPEVSVGLAMVTLFSTVVASWLSIQTLKKQADEAIMIAGAKSNHLRPSLPTRMIACVDEFHASQPKDNYSQNFV